MVVFKSVTPWTLSPCAHISCPGKQVAAFVEFLLETCSEPLIRTVFLSSEFYRCRFPPLPGVRGALPCQGHTRASSGWGKARSRTPLSDAGLMLQPRHNVKDSGAQALAD